VKEFLRLAAERMDRLELALELALGRNSRGWLRKEWTGWNWLWHWLWEGILEAGCGEDGQAGTGSGILEAACGEDGQAGIGSGAGSGKEFSKLAAERMDKLELVLELDLGRNS
jgi:hypothetical protein